MQTWVYPSEQMFYNAMKRKGWQPSEDDMAAVVAIHNAGAARIVPLLPLALPLLGCSGCRTAPPGMPAGPGAKGPLPCKRASMLHAECQTAAQPVRLRDHLLRALPCCSERASVAGDTAVGGGARRRRGVRRTAPTQVQVRCKHGLFCQPSGLRRALLCHPAVAGGSSQSPTDCPADTTATERLLLPSPVGMLQGTAAGVLAQGAAAQPAGLQAAL